MQPGVFNPFQRDGYRVLGLHFFIHGHTNRFPKYRQLIHSCRTIDVAGNQHRFVFPLGLEKVGQLGAKGGLTTSLQSGDQHHTRISFNGDSGRLATHEVDHLILDDLDHEFARLYRGQYVFRAKGLVLDFISKLLGYFIIDVRCHKAAANLFNRFRDVQFGQLGIPFERFKRIFKVVSQVLKHNSFGI